MTVSPTPAKSPLPPHAIVINRDEATVGLSTPMKSLVARLLPAVLVVPMRLGRLPRQPEQLQLSKTVVQTPLLARVPLTAPTPPKECGPRSMPPKRQARPLLPSTLIGPPVSPPTAPSPLLDCSNRMPGLQRHGLEMLKMLRPMPNVLTELNVTRTWCPPNVDLSRPSALHVPNTMELLATPPVSLGLSLWVP